MLRSFTCVTANQTSYFHQTLQQFILISVLYENQQKQCFELEFLLMEREPSWFPIHGDPNNHTWLPHPSLSVLRVELSTAPCCSSAHSVSVGSGLCSAEAGASVWEFREPRPLSASHCQSAGKTLILHCFELCPTPLKISSVFAYCHV